MRVTYRHACMHTYTPIHFLGARATCTRMNTHVHMYTHICKTVSWYTWRLVAASCNVCGQLGSLLQRSCINFGVPRSRLQVGLSKDTGGGPPSRPKTFLHTGGYIHALAYNHIHLHMLTHIYTLVHACIPSYTLP